jgi:hypothetical protein
MTSMLRAVSAYKGSCRNGIWSNCERFIPAIDIKKWNYAGKVAEHEIGTKCPVPIK